MSTLIEALGGILFSGLGYLTAVLLLPFISFGAVRAERLDGEGPFRWHGLKMVGDKVVVQWETAATVGLLVWVAGLVAALLWFRG